MSLFFLCSQLQTLQFLNSVLAFLPACCSIQPVKGTRGQEAAQMLSLALEREVVSLRDCVSSLLTDKEEGRDSLGHEETPEPGSVKGLQRCRDLFQRDVERSRRRLSPLVEVQSYRRLTQSMSEVQLHGDLAALLETQRTLLSWYAVDVVVVENQEGSSCFLKVTCTERGPLCWSLVYPVCVSLSWGLYSI